MLNIIQVGENLQTTGDKITSIGNKLLLVSATISTVGAASTKIASDFEDAIDEVSTIRDTSQVPLDELESSILDLSNQTGISSTEIANNVYNAISTG